MRIKRFILVTSTILFLIGVGTGCQKQPVEELATRFEDQSFRDLFEDTEYKEEGDDRGAIWRTQSQLARMTSLILYFPEGWEGDLKDLSKFPNLRGLTIHGANDAEILQVSKQKQLKALRVLSPVISADMSPLGEMKNVKALTIGANSLDADARMLDWSFIEKMEQLETIYIEHVRLENLDFLKKLPNLVRVVINDVEIEDISALKTLTSLKYLDINRDKRNDYSQVLSDLSSLEQIALSDCENMSDFSFLKNMSELQWISLEYVGSVNLKEYVTLEKHPKLCIVELDSDSQQENSAYLAEITPLLEERQKESAVTAEFRDKRLYFSKVIERMRPVEIYDD